MDTKKLLISYAAILKIPYVDNEFLFNGYWAKVIFVDNQITSNVPLDKNLRNERQVAIGDLVYITGGNQLNNNSLSIYSACFLNNQIWPCRKQFIFNHCLERLT